MKPEVIPLAEALIAKGYSLKICCGEFRRPPEPKLKACY